MGSWNHSSLGETSFLGLLLGSLAVSATLSAPLKHVDHDGESLRISNYLSTDHIAGEFRPNEPPGSGTLLYTS
jgi:hypothetical protein